ncbi:hypothetical protein SISSUDRAFT_535210 [Sistotremastrum suecicum HHB10207 ss-3]|uniref:Uncharacterized protein n=1 Tax=Sistotremastrum suecicum HHB10207 ss-3 TaxID=1314776 RepID=A0A165XRV5_9AGAM|nr:hypothetical protein SISSUDRAFT_535210 [Sistotremastrum suecicum HHB10207 ss-3]
MFSLSSKSLIHTVFSPSLTSCMYPTRPSLPSQKSLANKLLNQTLRDVPRNSSAIPSFPHLPRSGRCRRLQATPGRQTRVSSVLYTLFFGPL